MRPAASAAHSSGWASRKSRPSATKARSRAATYSSPFTRRTRTCRSAPRRSSRRHARMTSARPTKRACPSRLTTAPGPRRAQWLTTPDQNGGRRPARCCTRPSRRVNRWLRRVRLRVKRGTRPPASHTQRDSKKDRSFARLRAVSLRVEKPRSGDDLRLVAGHARREDA